MLLCRTNYQKVVNIFDRSCGLVIEYMSYTYVTSIWCLKPQMAPQDLLGVSMIWEPLSLTQKTNSNNKNGRIQKWCFGSKFQDALMNEYIVWIHGRVKKAVEAQELKYVFWLWHFQIVT